MTLWVDGDSCPRGVLEVILKAGQRTRLPVKVAADRELPGVHPPQGELLLAPPGEGLVDQWIYEGAVPGDLVITRDISLALRLCQGGITVMNDRGRIWTIREARARAAESEIRKAFRGGALAGRGRNSRGSEELKAFADALDRFLSHREKGFH